MGTEDVTVRPDSIRQIDNMAMGYNADGTPIIPPFMTKTDLALMGGCGLFTLYGSRKQFGQPLTWNGQNVSRWGYTRNYLKANFSSLSNFNNMEFVDTHTARLEEIMAKVTPKLPENFAGNAETKALFEKLAKAKSPVEYSEILRTTPNGKANYRKLCNILKRTAPEELAKLKNVASYNQMYGDVLQEFRTAQTTMRSGQSLERGKVSKLHKQFADARYAENKWLRSPAAPNRLKPKAGIGTRMSAGTKKALAASKLLRKCSRGAGKAGGVLMAAMTLIGLGTETYAAASNAKKGEGWKDGSRQLAKSGARAGLELGGMFAGMKAGAAIGAFGGPVGAAIGGVIGSFVGWAAGAFAANKIKFINKSVIEERQEEENKKMESELQTAIENKDTDTIAEYVAQFIQTEPQLDEQGNPKVDAQGNPVLQFVTEQAVDAEGKPLVDEDGQPVMKYKYIQVSEDPKIQKEFEEKVASLTNYVETEYSKQERAEQLRQEAEERRQATIAELQREAAESGSLYDGYMAATRSTSSAASTASQVSEAQNMYNSYMSSRTSNNSYLSWQNPVWQNGLADRYNRGTLGTGNYMNSIWQ